MMPWKLLADSNSYIFGWLVGYSAFLGPIAGVMIADYFLVRKASLTVEDLYRRQGAYEYTNGFNLNSLWSLAAGIVIAVIGAFVPSLAFLYRYAWFVGFIVSALIYFALMSFTGEKAWPSPKQQSPAQVS